MTTASGVHNGATSARRAAMLKSAFGPVIGAALADPDVLEILANPDGSLWIERAGEGRKREAQPIRPADAERIIRLVASGAGFDCDAARPIVSAELPETGERFEGVLHPVSTAPAFAIRKPAVRVLSLDEYVESGVMTATQAFILRAAIAAKNNILIAGGASSGKTTLVNALLAEIAQLCERIVILEDTRELQCAADDRIALRTSESADLQSLVRATMRLRPDRIIVGEVRGGEALDLLKVWNTGHPGGVATIHANSAAAALSRLEQLIGERTANVPRQLIADAVDVVVFIAKTPNGRAVREIIRISGLNPDQSYRIASAQGPELSLVIQGDLS
ncbi:MAG: P-type conjugative transfer ATPase TrbB [Pseudomonadota bacterium]